MLPSQISSWSFFSIKDSKIAEQKEHDISSLVLLAADVTCRNFDGIDFVPVIDLLNSTELYEN